MKILEKESEEDLLTANFELGHFEKKVVSQFFSLKKIYFPLNYGEYKIVDP